MKGLILYLCIALNSSALQPMRIQIDNIRSIKGSIRIAVYNTAAGFLQDEHIIFRKSVAATEVNGNTLEMDLKELPEGVYAVAVYHDLNNNGQIDKNMMGIPTEPYAFSNGAGGKWKAPVFSEAAIKLSDKTRLQLKLKYWKEY